MKSAKLLSARPLVAKAIGSEQKRRKDPPPKHSVISARLFHCWARKRREKFFYSPVPCRAKARVSPAPTTRSLWPNKVSGFFSSTATCAARACTRFLSQAMAATVPKKIRRESLTISSAKPSSPPPPGPCRPAPSTLLRQMAKKRAFSLPPAASSPFLPVAAAHRIPPNFLAARPSENSSPKQHELSIALSSTAPRSSRSAIPFL